MATTYLLATVLTLLVTVVLGKGNVQGRQLLVATNNDVDVLDSGTFEDELRNVQTFPYRTCSLKAKCTKNGGYCQAKGSCPGKSTKGCSRGCSCCLPVPTVEICAAKHGFCVETSEEDHCNGQIKILHNSCEDHCTCCAPNKIECPDGFVMSNNSLQCFKMFTDEKKRTWEEGFSKCHSEGLVMARPTDDIAVQLRQDLVDQYGAVGMVWVGARGGGSNMVWRDGTVFRNDSTLLGTGGGIVGDFTPDFCLAMMVLQEFFFMTNYYRERPYISLPCSYSEAPNPYVYTLCELIMN